MYINYIATTIK